MTKNVKGGVIDLSSQNDLFAERPLRASAFMQRVSDGAGERERAMGQTKQYRHIFHFYSNSTYELHI